jgi:hypothetical protein
MNNNCEKTAHSQNILHVDALHNIKEKEIQNMCQHTICTSFCLFKWTLIRETHQQTVRCFKLSLQLSERSVVHLNFSPQYLTLQF